MTTKFSAKKRAQSRSLQKATERVAAHFPDPVGQRRRSAFEFSCGLDDPRALLVEESLDERERRG
jgi:hypothetical protein